MSLMPDADSGAKDLRYACPRGRLYPDRPTGRVGAAARADPRRPVPAAHYRVHLVHLTAAPVVRDRGRRRILPAPGPGNPPKDGSQTDRQNPRAGYRRIIPSPPRSLRAVRRGSRSCAAPKSWRRDFSSVRPNRRRRAISATAIMTTMMAPPPPEPLLSLSEEEDEDDDDEDEDEDDHDDPPLEFQLRLVNIRKNSSPKKPTTPAMITAITISCTSPLRMWVSSWPSTASIS